MPKISKALETSSISNNLIIQATKAYFHILSIFKYSTLTEIYKGKTLNTRKNERKKDDWIKKNKWINEQKSEYWTGNFTFAFQASNPTYSLNIWILLGIHSQKILVEDPPPPTNSINTSCFSSTLKCSRTHFIQLCISCREGHAVAQLVEALRYKSEGRGFDSRWCHWNFSLT